MTWLVTGGAGYIGAHVVRAMVQDGQSVVALDDLSTGSRERVHEAPLVEGSVLDRNLLDRSLREHAVRGVVHIAAKKQVGESVADPLLYYRENLSGLVTLLSACRGAGVDRFVFSSSAATYGLPDVELVTEWTDPMCSALDHAEPQPGIALERSAQHHGSEEVARSEVKRRRAIGLDRKLQRRVR